MRISVLLVVISLISSEFAAQDWQPFVYGTRYYYSRQIDENLEINWLKIDTSHYYGYDGFRYLHELSCEFWDILQLIEAYDDLNNDLQLNYPLFFREQEVAIELGVLSRNGEDIFLFEFRPNSVVGESWITNSVMIECISADTISILGEPDSIKTYRFSEPYDSYRIVLSKSHGLIRFPSFRNFETTNTSLFEPDFFLIGLEDSLASKGFRQPSFHDHFKLNTGDILYWKDISIDYWIMKMDTSFIVDTIINIYSSPDTVIYYKHSARFGAKGNYLESIYHSDAYYKEREGWLLEGQPSWIAAPEIGFEAHHDFYYALSSMWAHAGEADTIIRRCAESAFGGFDDIFFENCTMSEIFDYGESFCYSSDVGINYQYWYGLGGYREKYVIGSIVDGIPQGIVEIPTTIKPIFTSETNVYPNPVVDQLIVDRHDQNIQSFELYDLQGQLLMRDMMDGSIDLSSLNAGIYFLRLLDKDLLPISQARIIKE